MSDRPGSRRTEMTAEGLTETSASPSPGIVSPRATAGPIGGFRYDTDAQNTA